MPTPNTQKKLLQRQIPTILGLIILVVALGAGLFFFSDGLGVFAPRATPETTPKNPQLTNVSDTGFTVSFLTDDATAGFIKYGTSPEDLRSQASDDRDQLSGSVSDYTLHHITLRGLDPATQYYYVLGTGSGSEFDDNGQPFSVKTAARAGTPSAAKTIYGNVLNSSGGPAEGSIVYVSADGMGEMSSLVKSSGSWAVPLSNARTPDGASYASITDSTQLLLFAQGPQLALTSETSVAVADAQPVPPITLGQNGTTAVITSPSPSPIPAISPLPSVNPSPTPDLSSTTATGGANPLSSLPSPSPSASPASGSGSLSSSSSTAATPSATVVDLTKTTIPTITTTQPTIIGEAAPNVSVAITVNSTTQIQQTVTADANGEFELDLSQLEDELEPGQHTVSYTYTNPATGQPVTATKTFTVSTTAQLAQASTGGTSSTAQNQPFGSGNPVPVGGTGTSSATTPTPSPTPASGSATASGSARTSQPSTASGIPTSGSVSMTYALIIGGLFFLITGGWSYWVSRQLKEEGTA